jgi:xeroderma pigmentosum group C-complementing protein
MCTQLQPGPGGRCGGQQQRLGAGRGAGGRPAGAVLSSKADALSCCWAEVYCGSADKGRWVHVDVVNGYVDR